MDDDDTDLKPLEEDLVPLPPEIRLIPILDEYPEPDDEETTVYRVVDDVRPTLIKPQAAPHPAWIITGRNVRHALMCGAIAGAPFLLGRHPILAFAIVVLLAAAAGFVLSVRWTQPATRTKTTKAPLNWRDVDYRG